MRRYSQNGRTMITKTAGVALVTGASSGIGAVYADRLAQRGYGLLLVARDQSRLEQLADQFTRGYGVEAEALQADLTVPGDIARVEARLRDDAQISMLVNNAGVAVAGAFTEVAVGLLEDMLQLNVLAVMRLAHAAAKSFSNARRGAIINIGSVSGLMPELGGPVYGASKAFILHLTRALNNELSELGVRFQCVLPGCTRTEIWERSGINADDLDPELFMEAAELVDAALVGFDQGEIVTVPSLPDLADWDLMEDARQGLLPNLSKEHPAQRYGGTVPS